MKIRISLLQFIFNSSISLKLLGFSFFTNVPDVNIDKNLYLFRVLFDVFRVLIYFVISLRRVTLGRFCCLRV